MYILNNLFTNYWQFLDFWRKTLNVKKSTYSASFDLKKKEENRHAMFNVQFYLNPHLYIDFWLFLSGIENKRSPWETIDQ